MAGLYILGFLLGTLGLNDEGADPAELVARLGNPRFAVREKAGAALVELGRKALPTLSNARKSRDPEIRERVEILLERIEANALLEATPIRLDLKDCPMEEAVRAIEGESGMLLRFDGTGRGPGGKPSWPDRRLNVVTNGPVPFWEAVDRLCEGGGVQRYYPPGEGTSSPNQPPFELTLLPGNAKPPASDHGPFRVELLRIRDDRMRDYGSLESSPPSYRRPFDARSNPSPGPLLQSFFRAELLVSAEPRLRIIGGGAVEKTEGIDDFGRSLLKSPSQPERPLERRMNSHIDPALYPGLRYGQTPQDSKRSWVLSIPFVDLSPPGEKIAKLSGVVPVAVLARRPNPLVVSLDDAKGKTFVSGSTHLTIHEVAAHPKSGVAVDLSLVGPEGDALGQTVPAREAGGNTVPIIAPTDLLDLRLELIDDRGEPVASDVTFFSTNEQPRRVTIRARKGEPGSDRPESLRLRCWGVIGAALDVPFTFRNVAMPRSRLGTTLRTGIEGSHP